MAETDKWSLLVATTVWAYTVTHQSKQNEAKQPQFFRLRRRKNPLAALGGPTPPPHPVTITHTSSGPTVAAPGEILCNLPPLALLYGGY
eukprot:4150835-Prymnesium_polylepis.1